MLVIRDGFKESHNMVTAFRIEAIRKDRVRRSIDLCQFHFRIIDAQFAAFPDPQFAAHL